MLLGALVIPQVGWAQTAPPERVGPAAVPDRLPGAAPAMLSPAALPPPPFAPGSVAAPPSIELGALVPTVSRLPPGMTVQVRAGLLALLVQHPTDGRIVMVGQLPLGSSTFETLYAGGTLYVASGAADVQVLDVRDPLQPRALASFSPGGPVSTMWAGAGSLMLRRLDGSTLLFEVSDPAHPRYQGLVPPPPGLGPLRSGQLTTPADPYEEQSRLTISVRPFLFFANRSLSPTSGGGMVDFSYQYAKVSGLWWGIAVSPFVVNSYYDGVPSVNSRVWFGYSGRNFALAAAMGSGFTFDSAWVQLGPLFRFGRLERVHSMLRLTWSVFYPIPHPISGEFTLEGPINRRVGLRFNFTGDSALHGFYTTLGLPTYHGGDHHFHTTVLTPAVGFSYMLTNPNPRGTTPDTHHPGVIFSLTIEPRW